MKDSHVIWLVCVAALIGAYMLFSGPGRLSCRDLTQATYVGRVAPLGGPKERLPIRDIFVIKSGPETGYDQSLLCGGYAVRPDGARIEVRFWGEYDYDLDLHGEMWPIGTWTSEDTGRD